MKMLFLTLALLIFAETTIAENLNLRQHAVIKHIDNNKVKKKRHFKQIGIASWYGYQHAGRPTKSGEIFNPKKLTAAHNSLPMGTKVKVTNLENKKSVIVKINDTGGFAKYHRIIDLSLKAANTIGITGIGKVSIEAI